MALKKIDFRKRSFSNCGMRKIAYCEGVPKCSDYRANAEDLAQDIADADVKIACPVMSLWGADFYAVAKLFDMPKVWAEMADDLVTHAIPKCGHLPQEEQPKIVNELLLNFLDGWRG